MSPSVSPFLMKSSSDDEDMVSALQSQTTGYLSRAKRKWCMKQGNRMLDDVGQRHGPRQARQL